MTPAARVPVRPADITSRLISDALGRSVVVSLVERVGEEFGFAAETYRVELAGVDGPSSVIAKLWALRDSGDILELRFYRELAAGTPIRLPAYHYGNADLETGRAWLVLEALENFRQGDDLIDEPLDTVLRLAVAIAAVHAAWWNRAASHQWLPRTPRIRRDAEYLSSRRTDYLERFGPMTDPLSKRLFDDIPALVARAAEILADAPETLLHLDLGLDNVLFLQPGDLPVPIDWARCGRGPGVRDLASILFLAAPLDGFADVVEAYLAGLDGGSPPVDAVAVRRWLTGAMIDEFITRTLGVARWAATTTRGLAILARSVERTPHVLAAWRDFDPGAFERVLPD